MKYKLVHICVSVLAAVLLFPTSARATKFLELKVVDQDYLMVHFKDGEVIYHEDISRPDAYLGHQSEVFFANHPEMSHFNDELVVFGDRLNISIAAIPSGWIISSADDSTWGSVHAVHAWRKAKPFGVTNEEDGFHSELDHWIFLELPRSMKQDCHYTVQFPAELGSDAASAEVCFDIWSAQSEAVHVNIMGYSTQEKTMGADLYLWLGDGGARDYKRFEGKRVWLYNVNSGTRKQAGKVSFWKSAADSGNEATGENLTGSDVWNVDFKAAVPGRYRLVVEDVGCSMDFDISPEIYYQPYRYALLGYYYMRLDEPIDPKVYPYPRQPRFHPQTDPSGMTVYITDLNDANWDEPHFKHATESVFWRHRLPGNPVNMDVVGGHSDAFDLDRHLAHVSNIYDYLLPYMLTNGRLSEDNLGIRESGNGIPDILDEVRNEVDFFLSLRDPKGGYSHGVTNPSEEWTVMFQAGSTPIAAWANAANAAMMADAFRIQGCDSLRQYYVDKAVEAFEYASALKDPMLHAWEHLGDVSMSGRDFKQMAAAYLYNATGNTRWEKILYEESVLRDGPANLYKNGRNFFFFHNDGGEDIYCQIWGSLAYALCPHERHYQKLYKDILSSFQAQAEEEHLSKMPLRPSRRSTNADRWTTAQSVQLALIAHALTPSQPQKAELERMLYLEASWSLGRNPANIIEMTGLGQRHFTDVYATGRNDGAPGTHPGMTPFCGIETWTANDGGDSSILLDRMYPAWEEGTWPRQETFFNQRYIWSNGEFTPRETMRGKFALLAYLYGIRPMHNQ